MLRDVGVKVLFSSRTDGDCALLQDIVRFLIDEHHVDARASRIVERADRVPVIVLAGGRELAGLDAIVEFLEGVTRISGLPDLARGFVARRPPLPSFVRH